MSAQSLYNLFSAIFWAVILALTWIDLRKSFGTVGSIAVFVAIFAAFGLLFLLDRYLKKKKSEQWLSRYHSCLAVLFGLAVLVVMFLVLRSST